MEDDNQQQAPSEEKKTSAVGSFAKLAGKGIAMGMKAYQTTSDVAMEAKMMVASKTEEIIRENVSEETREEISKKASELKEYTKDKASKGAKYAGEKMNEVYVEGKKGVEEGRRIADQAMQDAFDALPEEQKQAIRSEREKMKLKIQRMKASALDITGPAMDRILDALMQKVKTSSTKDPQMPSFVKRSISRLIDDITPDIQLELGAAVHKLTLQQKERDIQEDKRCFCHPMKLRALFLYTYLPYDRSTWYNLKNPLYLLLLLITLVPVFGVRTFFFLFVLFLLAVPCPPDEFQMIQFIQKFKGFQFITGGFIAGLVGAFQYYSCTSIAFPPTCDEQGPGASSSFVLEIIEFVGNIVLVWIAFMLLARSEKKGGAQFMVETESMRKRMQEDEEATSVCCCGACVMNKTRGGRLSSLLRYDLFCFVFSVLCLVLFCVLIDGSGAWDGYSLSDKIDDWRFRASMFWTTVIYSLLSFPFVFFSLPVLKKVLTHAEATGFAPNGECVPVKDPQWPEVEEEVEEVLVKLDFDQDLRQRDVEEVEEKV